MNSSLVAHLSPTLFSIKGQVGSIATQSAVTQRLSINTVHMNRDSCLVKCEVVREKNVHSQLKFKHQFLKHVKTGTAS